MANISGQHHGPKQLRRLGVEPSFTEMKVFGRRSARISADLRPIFSQPNVNFRTYYSLKPNK